jgi:hypothetical protein
MTEPIPITELTFGVELEVIKREQGEPFASFAARQKALQDHKRAMDTLARSSRRRHRRKAALGQIGT